MAFRVDGRQSGSNPIALEPACITKFPENGIFSNFAPPVLRQDKFTENETLQTRGKDCL